MQEFLKEAFISILVGGFGLLIWACFSGLIHLLFYSTNLWEKYKITFRKSKDPKYFTKDDPIYEIKESEWDGSLYVNKWELGYDVRNNVQAWLYLIPWPIDILYYEYQQKMGYYACDRDDIEEFASKYTLEEYYEMRQREEDLERTLRLTRKNMVEELNSNFNKNYE